MTEKRIITQICIVVDDVKKANANWAKVLGRPEETIETIFPDGILHYAHTDPVEYREIQVAKYELGNFVLELLQVDDRKIFQRTLSEIGVNLPYHIGYFPKGSYSYVDAKEQLGIELSVTHRSDYQALFATLLNSTAVPLDELK